MGISLHATSISHQFHFGFTSIPLPSVSWPLWSQHLKIVSPGVPRGTGEAHKLSFEAASEPQETQNNCSRNCQGAHNGCASLPQRPQWLSRFLFLLNQRSNTTYNILFGHSHTRSTCFEIPLYVNDTLISTTCIWLGSIHMRSTCFKAPSHVDQTLVQEAIVLEAAM